MFLNMNNFICLKIVLNMDIIGFCFVEIMETRYHIISLALKKKYRRKGIGTKLINFLSFFVKNLGKKLTLYVHCENLEAINFYKKNGFNIFGNITRLL